MVLGCRLGKNYQGWLSLSLLSSVVSVSYKGLLALSLSGLATFSSVEPTGDDSETLGDTATTAKVSSEALSAVLESLALTCAELRVLDLSYLEDVVALVGVV